MKRLWITWEEQRRNWELSRSFNCLYKCFWDERKGKNRLYGYIKCLVSTFRYLKKNRPDILFVQNPSIVLALFSVLFKPYFKYHLVVDTHNGALKLESGALMKALTAFIQKRTDLTIVSNRNLLIHVNGPTLDLPDKLPEIPREENVEIDKLSEVKRKYDRCALYISSFADDEPIEQAIQAMKDHPDTFFFISGNWRKKYFITPPHITNVSFIGRVSWSYYNKYLHEVDYVIDLTNRENCLVCGAYEAVSACKPLILSNTATLCEYFGGCAIYCKNTKDSISSAIEVLESNLKDMVWKVFEMKGYIDKNWQAKFDKVLDFISKFRSKISPDESKLI